MYNTHLVETTSLSDIKPGQLEDQLQSQKVELKRTESEVSGMFSSRLVFEDTDSTLVVEAEKRLEENEEALRGLRAKIDIQNSKLGGFHLSLYIYALLATTYE